MNDPDPPASSPVLVLGIGNVLWADEGFGVRAVETLHRSHRFPDNVRLLDGGTQGLYLLHYVQEAHRLIAFDAIDWGLPPGTLKVILNDAVPLFMGAKKMSLHQTGFQEVLAVAKLTGHYPGELVLIGVQPVELDDYGGSLRDEVKARLPEAIRIALDYLQRWGCLATPREACNEPSDRLVDHRLNIEDYENGRPGADQACRIGDARVLWAPNTGDGR